MNARRVPLIIGIVLAVGTCLLMLNYLASARPQAAALSDARQVVVAVRDIPARVTIAADMVEIDRRQRADTDPDAFDKRSLAVGRTSLITIPAGSVVTRSKVGTLGDLALPRRLAHGLRAVSISVDRVKGVAGLIQPGDRIDVIAVPPRVGNETPRATTILRGALVLAMGGALETANATPAPSSDAQHDLTTVTLAVTPQQADLLALADVNTTLRLALRAPQEPIRAYPSEPLQLGVSQQPAPAPIVAAPAAAPRSEAPPAPRPRVITVHRVAAPAGIPLIDGDRLVGSSGPQS